MPGILARVRRAFPISIILLASLRAAAPAHAEDSYLLALTWHPGFCAERAAQAECKIAQKDQPRFTLHGLWPQWDNNGDGKRNGDDDFCVAGYLSRQIIIGFDEQDWMRLPPVQLSEAVSADLAQAMPGVVVGLDRHELWKHGSCTGLTAENYFATSIALLHEVERSSFARLVIDSAGETLDRKQLLDAFEAQFGRGSARALMLDCANDVGATALMEIRIRLKRSRITQSVTRDSLAIPSKPARGDCGTDVFVPGWPR